METRKDQIEEKFGWMSSKSFIIIMFLSAHVVLLSMMLFTFPIINRNIGAKAFDLRPFGYTVSEALAILQHLDLDTINFYLFPQLFLLDILYPAFLALLLSGLMIRLTKLIGVQSNLFIACFKIFPFIAMVSDYLENILIALMITKPNMELSGVIKMASVSTQTKSTFTTLSWCIILVLFMVWLKERWSDKRPQLLGVDKIINEK